jgi:hypothetical protein
LSGNLTAPDDSRAGKLDLARRSGSATSSAALGKMKLTGHTLSVEPEIHVRPCLPG